MSRIVFQGKEINCDASESVFIQVLPFLHILLRAYDAMPFTFREVYGVERNSIVQAIKLVNNALTT